MSGIEPVLRTLSTGVTARPRLTHYDTVDGFPERIELSGRVLLNWVHKAANLLREEFDLEPGARVVVDLPAGHWRAAYWALAAWAVGACVVVPSPEAAGSATSAESATDTDSPAQDADVVVSRDAGDGATWPPRVVVTLAALARRHPDGVPQGAFDEAAVLSTYGDVFDDGAEPDPDAPALVTAGADGEEIVSTFAELSASGAGSGAEANERVLLVDPSDPAATLQTLLHTWAADGSVVVSRSEAQSPEEDALQRLADSEGITRRA